MKKEKAQHIESVAREIKMLPKEEQTQEKIKEILDRQPLKANQLNQLDIDYLEKLKHEANKPTQKVMLVPAGGDVEVQTAQKHLDMMDKEEIFNKEMSAPELMALDMEYKILPPKKQKMKV